MAEIEHHRVATITDAGAPMRLAECEEHLRSLT
jgi:hypothetical protein